MSRTVVLTETALSALQPFHFFVDDQLRISGWGPSLPRILPAITEGISLTSLVNIQRPRLVEVSYAELSAHQGMLFVLHQPDSGLLLRGQFIALPAQRALLFAGTPWLAEVGDLKKYDLALNDFAVHDATADLLQVLQHAKIALSETASLAERIRQQRMILQGILSTAADAIITINATGVIETFNPAAEQMFGWTAQEITGLDVNVLMPEPHASQHGRYLASFLSEPAHHLGGQRREVMARRRDGEDFPAELSLSCVQLADNTLFTGILRDISQRKQQDAALAEARERELRMGHEIQQSLLFGKPLRVPGLEIAAFTQPSQGIDGDFFDFFPIQPACFDVLTGDVMGKGVAAAMLGAAFKHQYTRLMTELMAPALSIGDVPCVTSVINELHNRVTPEMRRLESFITVAFVRVDLLQNQIEYINAGHPEALLFDMAGKVTELAGNHLPLGILDDELYTSTHHPFKPGDLLLQCSDGVTEARNHRNELLGKPPIIAMVGELHRLGLPAAIILQRLRQLVDQHEQSLRRSDDFTALALLRQGDILWLSQEFKRQMSELASLRSWIREHARLAEARLDALELATVEVATNIIRHARAELCDADFVARLRQHEHTIVLELCYIGDCFDPNKAPEPDFSGNSDGGFGVFIIRKSVNRVSYLHPAHQVNLVRLEIW
ncbi:PAS domain S-box protein [Aquitalea sp. S1-19]|nr:PAS domain S-box protein [Aquitalea sp. S1-19]